MTRPKPASRGTRASRARRSEEELTPVLEGVDASLLDIVDHVLTKGVVVTGDLVLGVADVDLVYLRVSAVLCAADRILGPAYASSRRRRVGKDRLDRALLSTSIATNPARKTRR